MAKLSKQQMQGSQIHRFDHSGEELSENKQIPYEGM